MMSVGSLPACAQLIVGHRGASYDGPENTVAAFGLAFEQNVNGVEGDFYVTKDGQPLGASRPVKCDKTQ